MREADTRRRSQESLSHREENAFWGGGGETKRRRRRHEWRVELTELTPAPRGYLHALHARACVHDGEHGACDEVDWETGKAKAVVVGPWLNGERREEDWGSWGSDGFVSVAHVLCRYLYVISESARPRLDACRRLSERMPANHIHARVGVDAEKKKLVSHIALRIAGCGFVHLASSLRRGLEGLSVLSLRAVR